MVRNIRILIEARYISIDRIIGELYETKPVVNLKICSNRKIKDFHIKYINFYSESTLN